MRGTILTLIVFLMPCLGNAANPEIYAGGIRSSADNADGLTRGLAPGSLFTIYGLNLASATTAVNTFPLPTRLEGVRVLIDQLSSLEPLEAPLLYISVGQINAVMPSNLDNATGRVFVEVNGIRSVDRPFTRIASRFAPFTTGNLGFGPATAQQVTTDGSLVLNSLMKPAQPGGIVVLWGTGIGALLGDSDTQPATARNREDISVSIGGILVKPVYAGRAPGFAGLDQINVLLPAQVRSGCYVPVIVYTPHSTSSTITLSLGATDTTCTSELNLPQTAIEQLAAGNLLRVTALSFDSVTNSIAGSNASWVARTAEAWTGNYDANTLSLLVTGWTPRPPTPAGTINTYGYSSGLRGYQGGLVSLDPEPPAAYRYGRPVFLMPGIATPIAGITGASGCAWLSRLDGRILQLVPPASTCQGTSFSLASDSSLRSGLLPAARSPIGAGSFRTSQNTDPVTADWNAGLGLPEDELKVALGRETNLPGGIFGSTTTYRGVVAELDPSAVSFSVPSSVLGGAFRNTASIEFGSRSFLGVQEDEGEQGNSALTVVLMRNRTIAGY